MSSEEETIIDPIYVDFDYTVASYDELSERHNILLKILREKTNIITLEDCWRVSREFNSEQFHFKMLLRMEQIRLLDPEIMAQEGVFRMIQEITILENEILIRQGQMQRVFTGLDRFFAINLHRYPRGLAMRFPSAPKRTPLFENLGTLVDEYEYYFILSGDHYKKEEVEPKNVFFFRKLTGCQIKNLFEKTKKDIYQVYNDYNKFSFEKCMRVYNRKYLKSKRDFRSMSFRDIYQSIEYARAVLVALFCTRQSSGGVLVTFLETADIVSVTSKRDSLILSSTGVHDKCEVFLRGGHLFAKDFAHFLTRNYHLVIASE